MYKVLAIVVATLWSVSVTAQEGVLIDVAYREPADAFEILDNVSDWWPGYTNALYRRVWLDTTGISPEDSALFQRYTQLRNRYIDRTGQEGTDPRSSRSGLFTDRSVLTADPIAQAFYQSETMDEAFDRLSLVVEPDEVNFLREFFAHFADRVAPLTAETRKTVAGSLDKTRGVLAHPAVLSYLKDVRAFIGSKRATPFTALYVWWPDADRITANPRGTVLLLRVRPKDGETINSADVVAHEAVHVFVATQSDTWKRHVSDTLLAACPTVLDRTRRLGVIEEPLATVFGNIEFRRRFDVARFGWGRRWYGESWVDLMARLLHPVAVEHLLTGQVFEEAFSKDAAALCQVVLDAVAVTKK